MCNETLEILMKNSLHYNISYDIRKAWRVNDPLTTAATAIEPFISAVIDGPSISSIIHIENENANIYMFSQYTADMNFHAVLCQHERNGIKFSPTEGVNIGRLCCLTFATICHFPPIEKICCMFSVPYRR